MSRYNASGRQLLPQDGERIPACPPVERPWMTMREAVALINSEYSGQVTEHFNAETGELIYIVGRNPLPSESELKYSLAGYRAKNTVNSLTFLLSNSRDENDWVWLTKKGFARYEGHPKEHLGMTAFTKSYVKQSQPQVAPSVEKEPESQPDPLTRQIECQVAELDKEIAVLKAVAKSSNKGTA